MIGSMSEAVRAVPVVPPVDRRTAWKIVISVVVVVSAVSGLLYASLKEEIQLWKSPDEVAQTPTAFKGKRLNVGGHVLSLTADRNSLIYNFEIESRPPRPHAVVKARYHGLVPDTFKTGGEVVATGKIADDGTLVAETIMAKCPSKYDMKGGPAIGGPADKKY
jgi:cytochrome c-type biogenesis protein CcmE